MCFLFSLFPATILTAVGFVVLFCSTRSAGGVKAFGKALAIWIFILAALPPIMGAYVTATGICPMERMIEEHAAEE